MIESTVQASAFYKTKEPTTSILNSEIIKIISGGYILLVNWIHRIKIRGIILVLFILGFDVRKSHGVCMISLTLHVFVCTMEVACWRIRKFCRVVRLGAVKPAKEL